MNAIPSLAPAPALARVALLVGRFEIEPRDYPVPALLPGEILVKVEGCGICGTDVHEYKRDPFKLIPVVLGHEGTGEIIALGSADLKAMLRHGLNVDGNHAGGAWLGGFSRP